MHLHESRKTRHTVPGHILTFRRALGRPGRASRPTGKAADVIATLAVAADTLARFLGPRRSSAASPAPVAARAPIPMGLPSRPTKAGAGTAAGCGEGPVR